MSDNFKERERAFEAHFAQNDELRFKAEARRNKKLAEWASGLLGVSADDYTKELIKADMELAGPEDVVVKLIADLEGKADEAAIREKLTACDRQAREEIFNEG